MRFGGRLSLLLSWPRKKEGANINLIEDRLSFLACPQIGRTKRQDCRFMVYIHTHHPSGVARAVALSCATLDDCRSPLGEEPWKVRVTADLDGLQAARRVRG